MRYNIPAAMSTPIEDVKSKIDIVEYIGRFVSLKKTGRNFKAPCPFHNEKTPSFIVSPDRQIWRCFGACQTGGDVISFLMKWENITFFEALRELAQQTGTKLENINFEDKEWKKKEILLSINNAALKFFHYLLNQHAAGKDALTYLEKRGLNKNLIETFQLGYAPKSWDSLLTFLIKKGFSQQDIFQTGLIIRSQRGKFYDRFRGRLMFPIIDARDMIIGFSGRLIEESLTLEVDQAKYVNTPETPIYHKRETLYGINVAKEAIKNEQKVVVVEGEFDMISCYKHGVKNTVAIKGSAFTKDQLMLIKRYAQHLILALDADFSGTETTKRAIEDTESLDLRIDIVQFDFAKDPDEAFQHNSLEFKKKLKNPIPIYDFIIQIAKKRQGDEPTAYAKKAISDEVIPFLANITNPIIKTHYVKRLAEILEVNESSVESLLHRFNIKKRKQKISYIVRKSQQGENRYNLLQKYILSLMVQNEQPIRIYRKAQEVLDENDFSIPSYKNLLDHLGKYYEINKAKETNLEKFNIQQFTSNLSAPLQSVFDELFLFDASLINNETLDKDINRSLYELKQLSLKDKIKQAINSEDTTLVKEYSKSLSEVEKKLSSLYN